LYIWEKYRTFEITSGIIFKMNLPLYKGFTLEITNKWWPLYRIKIYSKMHRESTKVTIMSRWPLYKGHRYDRFDCSFIMYRPRAPDNFQVQRVITSYFWKWWVFAYFLCILVLSTSEKIAYMYTFKIMFDTSVIQ
jgi:hypothetical protein